GGGRRYYRPDDVDLLRGIRHLLYGEGYTICGVQRILRGHGAAFVGKVWRAGAEPPPPQLAEESQGDGAGAYRGEPSLFSGSTDDIDRAGQEAGGFANPESRRKLEMALDDLRACRRIISATLSQD